MSGSFSTNQGTLDKKILSNDKEVFGKNDLCFTLGCNSRCGEANGAAHNTLKSEMNLKYF